MNPACFNPDKLCGIHYYVIEELESACVRKDIFGYAMMCKTVAKDFSNRIRFTDPELLPKHPGKESVFSHEHNAPVFEVHLISLQKNTRNS